VLRTRFEVTVAEFSSIEASGTDTPFAENGLSCSEIIRALVKRIRIPNNGAKSFRAPVIREFQTTLSIHIHRACIMYNESCGVFKRLAPELFFLILAHPVHKM